MKKMKKNMTIEDLAKMMNAGFTNMQKYFDKKFERLEKKRDDNTMAVQRVDRKIDKFAR